RGVRNDDADRPVRPGARRRLRESGARGANEQQRGRRAKQRGAAGQGFSGGKGHVGIGSVSAKKRSSPAMKPATSTRYAAWTASVRGSEDSGMSRAGGHGGSAIVATVVG